MSELPLAERGRLLSELATTLATLPTDRPQTWRLGEAMRRMLAADGVAITVEYLSDGRTTVCASDDVAVALEDLQEISGEGPGYEAATRDIIVVARLGGTDADQRWPMLEHAVEERFGAVSLHAVPLHADGSFSAVATLYTKDDRALSQPPDRTVFLANAIGAALLVDAPDLHEGQQPHVGGSWSSRAVVHQATGMVMEQVAVTPEDALALLRGHAYALETDINDVAARVVDRTTNFSSFEVEGD
jgi:hypothetical protein